MRTKSTLINSFASLVQRLLPSLLVFLTRTVFINTFGATYLGIDSLFLNILNMLSIVEFGVGDAMVYYLYKPLANQDIEQIKRLMKLYRKLYFIIGSLIGVIGLGLIPFLNYFVTTEQQVPNLVLIYVLMLFNVVLSYFYTYQRSLFQADQKNYINSLIDTLFNILKNILLVVFMLMTKSYFTYLIVQLIMTLSNNITIYRKSMKEYPYLKEAVTTELEDKDKKHIFSRIGAYFFHRIGSIVATGTDNLLMSLFSNIEFIGIYSNYALITSIVFSLFYPFSQNLTASVGNLDATSDENKVYEIFKLADFINYFMFSFATICLYFLLNPFIEFWLGEKFVLNNTFLIVIIVNFYLSSIRQTSLSFSNAKGFFYDTRFKPVVEVLVDLIIGLVLAYFMGPIGIILGTTIGYIFVSVWVEPYILFTKWFKLSPFIFFKKHVFFIIKNLVVIALIHPIYGYILANISVHNFYQLLILVASTVLMTLILLFLLNMSSNEIKEIRERLKLLVNRSN